MTNSFLRNHKGRVMWKYQSVKYLKRKKYSERITIMRNKILFCLFALVHGDFLDIVLPMACPWVPTIPAYLIKYSAWVYSVLHTVYLCEVQSPTKILAQIIFRDQEIGERCENQCETDFVDCTSACDDTNCILECGRVLTNCVNGT